MCSLACPTHFSEEDHWQRSGKRVQRVSRMFCAACQRGGARCAGTAAHALASNFTTSAITVAGVRGMCQVGAPRWPVVEASIAGVHQVRPHCNGGEPGVVVTPFARCTRLSSVCTCIHTVWP
jgi:hypothetical protein